jgi:hypothetical protein
MKQLYYTCCVPGRSKTGESGFQVRAVSRDLSTEQQRAVLRHVGYRLPAGYDEDTAPQNAPQRLALLHTEVGRLLCHSAHTGRDPVTKRTGAYFTHALIDAQGGIDAAAATATWKAPFWVTSDGDMSVDLPELSLPQQGAPDLARLVAWARGQQALMRFLVVGALTLPPDQRLFVVAPANDVCQAVGYLAQLLPPGLAEALTFSTYESDPLSCNARVVGTWWKADGMDLPSACYQGCGMGYNSLTGKTSPLPEPRGLTARVLDALSQGRPQELTAFYRDCRNLGLNDLAGLDLAWRLLGGASPTRADVEQALAYPRLLAELVGQPERVQQVVEWALTEPSFREAHFRRLVQSAPGDAARGRFSSAVWSAFVASLGQRDLERARLALEALLPVADPGYSRWLADRLASDLPSPEKLSWPARSLVLARVLQSQRLRAEPDRLDRWLLVSADQLEQLLALPLDEEARARAASLCLARAPQAQVGPALFALAKHRPLALRLFVQSASSPAQADLTQGLFRALLAASGKERGGALSLVQQLRQMHQQRQLSDALVEACLLEAFAAPGLPAAEVVRWDTTWLMKGLPPGKAQAALAERLLREQGAGSPQADPFLEAMRHHPSYQLISAPLRARLEQKSSLTEFLARPNLAAATLDAVAAALRDTPDGPQRRRLAHDVTRAVAHALLQVPPDRARLDLETALGKLGPVASSGKSMLFGLFRQPPPPNRWAGLFRELLDLLGRDRRALEKPHLLFALLCVGFNAPATKTWVASQYDNSPQGTARDTSRFITRLRRLRSGAAVAALKQIELLINQCWQQEPNARDWWKASLADGGAPEEKTDWFSIILYGLAAGVVLGVALMMAFQFLL